MVQGRGDANNAIMDMLRQIVVRLEVVETAQRRGVHLDDVSDEEEAVAPYPEPRVEQDEERHLRALSRANSKPSFELSSCYSKLDTDALLDWIFEIKKYFDYESTPDDRKVRIAATKLRGHVSLC